MPGGGRSGVDAAKPAARTGPAVGAVQLLPGPLRPAAEPARLALGGARATADGCSPPVAHRGHVVFGVRPGALAGHHARELDGTTGGAGAAANGRGAAAGAGGRTG